MFHLLFEFLPRVGEIEYGFMKLGISSEDLEALVLTWVSIMKNMSSSQGKGEEKWKLEFNLGEKTKFWYSIFSLILTVYCFHPVFSFHPQLVWNWGPRTHSLGTLRITGCVEDSVPRNKVGQIKKSRLFLNLLQICNPNFGFQ